jgi:hypothetical protein
MTAATTMAAERAEKKAAAKKPGARPEMGAKCPGGGMVKTHVQTKTSTSGGKKTTVVTTTTTTTDAKGNESVHTEVATTVESV